MVDEQLMELSQTIDNLLIDSCLKYEIGYDVMTAIVLARIVSFSQQIGMENDIGRLLYLAQSSTMEPSNQTLQ